MRLPMSLLRSILSASLLAIAAISESPARLAAQTDVIRGIMESAKSHGLIAHRFYGSEGQIMVLDEWPDPPSFQQFFDEQRSTIEPLMGQVATSEPEITFWRKLETHDEYGWD